MISIHLTLFLIPKFGSNVQFGGDGFVLKEIIITDCVVLAMILTVRGRGISRRVVWVGGRFRRNEGKCSLSGWRSCKAHFPMSHLLTSGLDTFFYM